MYTRKHFLRNETKIPISNIKDKSGVKIGVIKELVIDLSYGNIAYAVISLKDWLAGKEKYFAVPWEALKLNKKDNSFILKLNMELLDKVKRYHVSKSNKSINYNFVSSLYNHFGYQPYWKPQKIIK